MGFVIRTAVIPVIPSNYSDDIFKLIFLDEIWLIVIQIPLLFVANGSMNNM